jgi:hypothetical protein
MVRSHPRKIGSRIAGSTSRRAISPPEPALARVRIYPTEARLRISAAPRATKPMAVGNAMPVYREIPYSGWMP